MTQHRRTALAVVLTIALLEIVHGIEEIALLPSYFAGPLGLGPGVIGFVVSSYLVTDLIFRTPAGWLTDRLGRRRVLLIGIVITAAVIPPMAFAREAWQLFVLNALNGVGAGTMWPAVYALMADAYPPGKRGVAMSVVNLFMVGGLASGPIIGNLVIGSLSHLLAFGVCFVLTLLALITALFVLREPAHTMRQDEETADEALQRGSLALVALATVLVSFGIALLLPIINLFGEQVLELGPVGLAGLLAVPALVTAVALPFSGVFADRVGRMLPLRLGLIVMALPFALSPLSTQPAVAALGATVAGLGYAMVAPSINALLLDYLPSASRGLSAGLIVAVQGVGIALGPAAGGVLYEQVGPYSPLFVTAAMLLAAFIAVLPLRGSASRPAKRALGLH